MFLQVCPVCEHRNPRGSRFCNECGSPLQLRFCPACHAAEDVMALECRSCGEKLPLVPLAEATPIPLDVAPAGQSIWKSDAPPPGLHLGHDGVVVTVHGGAESTPERDVAPAPEAEPRALRPSEPPGDSESAVATELPPEPVPNVEPVPMSAEPLPMPRGPNTIELFNAAQTDLELIPLSVTLPPAQAAELATDSVLLNTESESEIEVGAEAETLVEASVVPVTYQPPEEIAITESDPLDDIGSQLREGAWRSALVDDDEVTRLAPVLIQAPARPKRRLSMHRIGLMIAGLGAVGAVVYSGHLAPGTASLSEQTATPKPITTLPARSGVDALAPAAAVTAATPDTTHARAVESEPLAEMPKPITRAAEEPANKASNVLPPATAPAEKPAAVAVRADKQPPVPAVPAREPAAPRVVQARRLPLEAPRPCTPAIEALGLCKMEATQEGK